jgi:hypothetical protein
MRRQRIVGPVVERIAALAFENVRFVYLDVDQRTEIPLIPDIQHLWVYDLIPGTNERTEQIRTVSPEF